MHINRNRMVFHKRVLLRMVTMSRPGNYELCVELNYQFNSNKLVVNPNKSNVILIGPKSKVRDHTVFVTLIGIQIKQSKEITLLGLQIDNNLNFHSHINALAKKLSSKVGLLHRLGTFLPSNQLIMIYSAIIQSLIDYGITLWGSSHKTYLNSIQ